MGRQFLSFFHRSQRFALTTVFRRPPRLILYDSKGKGDEISTLAFSKVCLLPNYIQTPGWKYSEANGRIRKRSPDFQMGFCHIRRQPPTPIKKQVQIISVPAFFHILYYFNPSISSLVIPVTNFIISFTGMPCFFIFVAIFKDVFLSPFQLLPLPG